MANTAPVDVLAVLLRRQHGPEVDPDTGADRGSCCEHAWADGWNDCIGNLAEARAAIAELIEAANRAAIAAVRGDDNQPGTIRNADLDDLRAALARVGGAK